MDAVDLNFEPVKFTMPTGNPSEWLIGLTVDKARELLKQAGMSLRVVKRQGCSTFDARGSWNSSTLTVDEHPARPFRWAVELDENHEISAVLGRG